MYKIAYHYLRLYEYLSSFITDERKKRFEEVIKHRTRHITIVLEDIYQPHNASAVLRTAECLGIQDVHIIENKNPYNVNPDVALGSAKWINLKKHNGSEFNTDKCYTELKQAGYKIVATSPHQNGYLPNELPLDSPVAIVFGTELKGLTDYALEQADMYLKIPLFGFTESYNISVSAAIILSGLINRLHSLPLNWKLSKEEQTAVLLQWTRNTVKDYKAIEKDFIKKSLQK